MGDQMDGSTKNLQGLPGMAIVQIIITHTKNRSLTGG
jgi:hypothetical protein